MTTLFMGHGWLANIHFPLVVVVQWLAKKVFCQRNEILRFLLKSLNGSWLLGWVEEVGGVCPFFGQIFGGWKYVPFIYIYDRNSVRKFGNKSLRAKYFIGIPKRVWLQSKLVQRINVFHKTKCVSVLVSIGFLYIQIYFRRVLL